MVTVIVKAEWRCTMMVNGEQFVMIHGTPKTQM